MLNTAHLALYSQQHDRDFYIDAGICGFLIELCKLERWCKLHPKPMVILVRKENDEDFKIFLI